MKYDIRSALNAFRDRFTSEGVPRWLFVAVFIVGIILSLIVWQQILQRDRAAVQRLTVLRLDVLTSGLRADFMELTRALERMAARHRLMPNLERWEADASTYLDDFASLQRIELIDNNRNIKAVLPGQDRVAATIIEKGLVDINQGKTPLFLDREQLPSLMASLGLPADVDILAIPWGQDGMLLAYISIEDFIRYRMDAALPITNITVRRSGGEVVFSNGALERSRMASSTLHLFGRDWLLDYSLATEELPGHGTMPTIVLTSGVLVTVLLSVLLLIGQELLISARRARRELTHTQVALEEHMRQVERSNEELEQFAYVASHDLKSPLRGVAQIAEWLQEDYATYLPGPARDDLELLRGRVDLMGRLLDALLEYSRVGRNDTPPETVRLQEVIQEIFSLYDELPGVSLRMGGSLPQLHASHGALSRVIGNLVDNAIKHSREEGDDAIVEIRGRDLGQLVEVSVEDNGPGIPESGRKRVFQVFQRLKANGDGTGLGLSVVKKTVENAGGNIWIESSSLGGAAIKFTWPKRQTS